jgi:hypothetical protein
VTGSNSSRDKQKKHLLQIVQATIARRKLKRLGVTIVGVTNEEVIEFCKWYLKQREGVSDDQHP